MVSGCVGDGLWLFLLRFVVGGVVDEVLQALGGSLTSSAGSSEGRAGVWVMCTPMICSGLRRSCGGATIALASLPCAL